MLWAHLQTLFSFRAYHRLAHTSCRQRVWFVVYLVMLCVLVFHLFTSGYIRRNLPVFLKNFPQVTFEQGALTAPPKRVSAPVPQSDFSIVFDAARETPPSVEELAENKILMLIAGRTVYMPGANGVQTRTLPPALTLTTTPQWLRQNQPALAAALRAVSFMASLILIPFILLFDFCIAGAVGLFFNLLRPKRQPRSQVLAWALFMLGPLSVLWLVRLWVHIPLFTLAQVILCTIYMQQIFNTLPQEN